MHGSLCKIRVGAIRLFQKRLVINPRYDGIELRIDAIDVVEIGRIPSYFELPPTNVAVIMTISFVVVARAGTPTPAPTAAPIALSIK